MNENHATNEQNHSEVLAYLNVTHDDFTSQQVRLILTFTSIFTTFSRIVATQHVTPEVYTKKTYMHIDSAVKSNKHLDVYALWFY